MPIPTTRYGELSGKMMLMPTCVHQKWLVSGANPRELVLENINYFVLVTPERYLKLTRTTGQFFDSHVAELFTLFPAAH